MKYIIYIILVFGLTGLGAQETLSASGSNASGSGGSSSYTVGQVFCATEQGTNGSIYAGVQQPYEISTILDNQEILGNQISASVYPNPFVNNIQLEIKDSSKKKYTATIYDIEGKVLETKIIGGAVTVFKLDHLSRAVYFLSILHDNSEIMSFKIVKK